VVRVRELTTHPLEREVLERLVAGPREVAGAGMVERVVADLVAGGGGPLPAREPALRVAGNEEEGDLHAVAVEHGEGDVHLAGTCVVEGEAHRGPRALGPGERWRGSLLPRHRAGTTG